MGRFYSRSSYKHITVLLIIFAGIFCSPLAYAEERAKNVILLIADGCSSEQFTFARWFKGENLSLDPIRVGAIKTHMIDSLIADSAAAASAFATGVRTNSKFISVGPKDATLTSISAPPKDIQYRPLATVLEGARLASKSTGVVSTTMIVDATPAAFFSHTQNRLLANDIMEQAIYQDINVVLGGGIRHLLPKDLKGKRDDGEDLTRVLEEKGYELILSRDEMLESSSEKVFGVFSPSYMASEMDRKQIAPDQPGLEEMTKKAISILSKDPDGFLLMIEASQVDWACHANDPAQLASELMEYDRAAKVALDFARDDGNTLLLAFSDHNTGGFSIGNRNTAKNYTKTSLESLLDPIRNMKTSAYIIWQQIENNKTADNVRRVIKKDWGLDITAEEAEQILELAGTYKKLPRHLPYFALSRIISEKYTTVGWTSHGHVGGDVPLHAFGPGKPSGVIDGPEIAKICADAMGFDLGDVTKRLFADPEKALLEAKIKVEDPGSSNPLIKIDYHGKTYSLPVNKNILKTGKEEITLEGIVVYIPETGKAYIPMQAVNIIKGN